MNGRVVSGWGAARIEIPAINPARFPFTPYPGTLNVELTKPAVWSHPHVGVLPWFGYDAPWCHGTVHGIPCIVLGVVGEMPVGHKVELIAAVRLRRSLRLTDGDPITVTLTEATS